MKVSTVEEMRTLDRRAVVEFSIPESILMENAGMAAYSVMLRETGGRGLRFVVLCGLGNNGGDGLVVARKLHSVGAVVTVFVFGDVEKYGESPKMNYEMVKKSGVDIQVNPEMDTVKTAVAHCDAVVDALFGTGITREVGGRFREVIELVNAASRTVYSIDIPSGVDGNTGRIMGAAVRADYTVTFGLPKRGNLLYPGGELNGRLFVSHISYPIRLQNAREIKVELLDPVALPKRRVDGHKGTFGDVLFVAGAANYYGAPSFSALSLLKAGGGYARLAAPRSMIPHLASIGSEIVFAPQAETVSGSLSLDNLAGIVELSKDVGFVVLGPGLSLVEETQELAVQLAARIEKPLLIDGDGLTAVAQDTSVIKNRSEPTVLTPHVGEMSRIVRMPKEDILTDPVGVLRQTCQDLGAIIVLKGARSLVGRPDGTVFINLSGNSGMASAGSGDVLTGTIGAMYGLGLHVEEAVNLGVFMHGFAGDLAAQRKGEDGMTARDILETLPAATKAFRERYGEITANHYGRVEVL